MVGQGKHLLFMSGSDYGASMNTTVFYKYGPQLCNWFEPNLNTITDVFPVCPRCPSLSPSLSLLCDPLHARMSR